MTMTGGQDAVQDVLCLDFDGVLCDSAPETALSGWKAGAALWKGWSGPMPAELKQGFLRVRPVLETGYEVLLLLRLLREGMSPYEVLERFGELRAAALAATGRTPAELVDAFGAARDRWIAADLNGWLGVQGFFPGLAACVRRVLARGIPVFILTTKQERFARLLLERHDVRIPQPRVFGLESGRPKTETLAEVCSRPEFRDARIHFVEDRLKALEAVTAVPELLHVRLYLADWGYNTKQDRNRARENARITVLNRDEFLAAWS